MPKRGSKLFIIVLALFLMSCGATKAKPEAEALCTKYFEAVRSGSFQNALSLYGSDFYKITPKDEWLKMLQKVIEKLGPLKEYKLVNWNVTVRAQRSGGGTFVTLGYQVKYSMYDAQEIFLVFKPLQGGQVAILGHNINSKGLVLQ